jgi:hypothetical protein
VRTLVVLSLVGLLALCPVICDAGEVGGGAHRHGGAGDSRSHCSAEGDNCICQGAVRLDEAPTLDQNPDAVGLPPLLGPALHAPSHPVALLTRGGGGTPTGLARWGGPLAIRAFLQHFRC